MTNPFRFGTIVSGDYFYDREEELIRLKQILSGGNNVALYAPRRYGKSSLVKKALAELQEEGYVTVYLDFMSVYSRETFIKNYAAVLADSEPGSLEKTVKKIAKLISGIVPSVSFDSSGMPSFSFSWIEGKDKEQTLTEVIDLPQQLASDKQKWIVAFDEFQEVTKLNGENFEKLLRSSIQHHDKVSYLFFGSRTHLLKDMFNSKGRAFYHSASIMGMGKIEEAKSIQYLKNRFDSSGITANDKVTKSILTHAENIPYFIQFIASELWQTAVLNKKQKIEPEDVNRAVDQILLLKSDYYWELIMKQTPYRKKVLHTLCYINEELLAKETAKKYDLGAASTTQKALDSFVEDGLIERTGTKYEFSDPFFRRFVLQNI